MLSKLAQPSQANGRSVLPQRPSLRGLRGHLSCQRSGAASHGDQPPVSSSAVMGPQHPAGGGEWG